MKFSLRFDRHVTPDPSTIRRFSQLDADQAIVSVLVPVRNEAASIEATLDALLAQTFPRERMEIFVIDGMSEDGTRAIVQQVADRWDHVRLLDNPKRSIPAALNLGLQRAKGNVIVRIDGRCRVAHNYVQQCVYLLSTTDAANVGGPVRSEPRGPIGRAIATAMRSRFGVGNSRYHYLEREEFVDTVYMGAFRREIFGEIGDFDEELVRNQDDELNYRIRAAGYGILLSPSLASAYNPPEKLSQLWKSQFYPYGYWKVRVLAKHPGSLQPRHLAPPGLAGLLAISAAAAVGARKTILLTPLLAYGGAILFVAGRMSRARPLPTARLATVFAFMHLGYGFGFLHGLGRFLLNRATRSEAGVAGRGLGSSGGPSKNVRDDRSRAKAFVGEHTIPRD